MKRFILSLVSLFFVSVAYADTVVPSAVIPSTFTKESWFSKSVHISTVIWSDNSISTGAIGGGGSGGCIGACLSESSATATYLQTNTFPIDNTSRATNLVPKWNGSKIVWAAYNATYLFSVALFSDGLATVIEQGVGTWKAVGAMTFSATYTNGAATGGYVSHSGWSNLTMTNTYLGPTSSGEAVSFPSVGGTQSFTLYAAKGAETSNSTVTHYFYNDRHWGVSTVISGYTSANVNALASNDLLNVVATSFTVSPGASEYIIYAYPSRLGTSTFFVGGFEGGFNSPETVSVTNGSGFTENYYVYRSANSNLGSTVVTVQ